jgi:putative oxidoreductase
MLSILRIVAALLFVEHGTQKLLGFPFDPAMHQPALASMPGFAGVIELVGGVLLLVGLFTRVVAFILSGEMAVAYFKVHFPMSFYPVLSHGELAALYCFVFLYFAVVGGGAWSLDALLSRRTT